VVSISNILLWTILALFICIVSSISKHESFFEFVQRFSFIGFFNLIFLTVLSYFKLVY
jgi:hypothetical protein